VSHPLVGGRLQRRHEAQRPRPRADRGRQRVEAARDELAGRGVRIGEIQDLPWGRFLFFADPDGNPWSVQQIPPRG